VNGQFATPAAAWPTSTFIGEDKKLYFNGEGVHVIHQPAAHTDGDSLVFFRKSDVISTGDLFVTNGYPFIDLAAGGNVQGIVAGLNRIIDLCIPVYGQEGGTMVIPGHGRLSDIGDVINYREMVTIVRDRVQDLVKKNMTLEQVKAAKPTRDYDPLYNAPGAFITGDAFVEAVYRSLKK
jgi:glyoxylase-like metal-dependent hydrolase (beta-lactamase superfamily II)